MPGKHPALSAICLFALIACTPPPASGGFSGAGSSDAAFTSTPNGCVYSFLYDDFVLRRAAATPAATTELVSAARTSALNAPAHVAGAQVSLAVHGAALGAPGAIGTLDIEFAGSIQSFPLTIAEGQTEVSFAHTLTAPAIAGANTMRITATIPAAAAAEQQIHVDGADLSMGEAAFCANAEQ